MKYLRMDSPIGETPECDALRDLWECCKLKEANFEIDTSTILWDRIPTQIKREIFPTQIGREYYGHRF